MTNCGMVLPAPGYHEKLRELCTKYGTYLVLDETHTFSNGYGGYTKAYGLKPDFITLGKSIAGGIPVVYGFTREVAERINASFGRKSVSDPMGISGTLSGNAFAIAAMRETLTKVATEEAREDVCRRSVSPTASMQSWNGTTSLERDPQRRSPSCSSCRPCRKTAPRRRIISTGS